jgi:hypothetical protein
MSQQAIWWTGGQTWELRSTCKGLICDFIFYHRQLDVIGFLATGRHANDNAHVP